MKKKIIPLFALALASALAFPSCDCSGGKEEPAPPDPAMTTYHPSSVALVTEDLTSPSTESFSSSFTYDDDWQITAFEVKQKGGDIDYTEHFTLTYPEGGILLHSDATGEEQLLLRDTEGRIVGVLSGATGTLEDAILKPVYDTSGRLTAMRSGKATPYSFVWDRDVVTDTKTMEDMGPVDATFTYTDTPDLIGMSLFLLSEDLGFMPWSWFGRPVAYLPSQKIAHMSTPVPGVRYRLTTDYEYTLDSKGRATKIVGVISMESESSDFIPDHTGPVQRVTYTITYAD